MGRKRESYKGGGNDSSAGETFVASTRANKGLPASNDCSATANAIPCAERESLVKVG